MPSADSAEAISHQEATTVLAAVESVAERRSSIPILENRRRHPHTGTHLLGPNHSRWQRNAAAVKAMDQ